MKKIFLVFITLLITSPFVFSQSKIGFVQSDRIRAEFEEFKDAESQLQMEFRKVQFEYQTMLMSLDSMKKSFETQRLMSSPEWRREKEQEIAQREQTIQAFQAQKVGPEGELYKKQVNNIIDMIRNSNEL